PECVKRIWAYIKEHDLQDPKDRRQIRCDDKLRRVFKQDRVTMFNMNKHLSFNLYPPEEV
ncbi:MAG TPA: SWIB/MDM2 domain-containing protein, partial [Ktedonobacteraceae bacterium]|nr:SWIB/MDM2 domain-containing protein [Ktedonobacteraceae bacterium]